MYEDNDAAVDMADVPTSDRTIKAVYSVITYAVTYVSNGEVLTELNPASYTVETSAADRVLPLLENTSSKTFAGWYDNAEFSGESVSAIPADALGNKTYYAKWETVVI